MRSFPSSFFFCASLLAVKTKSQCNLANRKRILGNLLDPIDDLELPPIPWETNVRIEIFSVYDVNELQGSLMIRGLFSMTWTDQRMVSPECQNAEDADVRLPIALPDWDKIYTPSMGILSAIEASFMPSPSDLNYFFVTPSNGTLQQGFLQTYKLPCRLQYTNFPFDAMNCTLFIGNYAPAGSQKVVPGRFPLKIQNFVSLDTFHASGGTSCEPFSNGSFYRCMLTLRRYYGFYVCTGYVPNTLTVLVVLVAFHLPLDGSRIGLCLSTLMALILQFGNISRNLPKVGYIKGYDIWILGCMTFVTVALVEFGVMIYVKRKFNQLQKENEKIDEEVLLNKLKKVDVISRGGQKFAVEISDTSFALGDPNSHKIIRELLNDSDPTELPAAQPLYINSTYVIFDFQEMNEIKGSLQIQGGLLLNWTDSRLQHKTCDDQSEEFLLRDTHFSKIWIPPIGVLSAVSAAQLSAPTKMNSISIFPATGNVIYFAQMTIKIQCQTDYTNFPFDTIECALVVGSWYPETMFLLLPGQNNYVSIQDDLVKLPTFQIGAKSKTSCFKHNGVTVVCPLFLIRNYSFYILQFYLPNCLVILATWLSFSLPMDGMRISLCLSSLITLVLQYGSVSGNLPKVGYIKGLDIWVLGCVGFVLCPMLIFAGIFYIERQKKNQNDTEFDVDKFASKIDRIAKYAYIVAFGAFVAVIFTVYK